MASRTEYNACISKGLKGKTGLSKEERQLLFCTESRLCSGKASSREEAKASCSLPKVEKLESKPTRRKKFNPRELSLCLLEHIGDRRPTLAILSEGIAACQEAKKPYDKKQYIRDCIKESAILGTLAETVKLNKQCEHEWREKNGDPEAGYAHSDITS